MRFTFSAAPTGGVRLIGEIPDFPLCRLEGRNGIGKTLAIHLLELAAGGQPYAGAASAWRSLREHLGPVDIVVSGLRSTQLELRIHLSSESWPADPPSS